MPKQTTSLNAMDIRKSIGTYYDRVAYSNERIRIHRNGKPNVALISDEDLKRLERLDHQDDQHQDQRLDQMYTGLFELFGMIKDPVPNASTTIDEVLYGENGAWQGSHD